MSIEIRNRVIRALEKKGFRKHLSMNVLRYVELGIAAELRHPDSSEKKYWVGYGGAVKTGRFYYDARPIIEEGAYL